MRSSNPVLREQMFASAPSYGSSVMTIQGTGIKTMILLILAVISAGFAWSNAAEAGFGATMPWVFGGGIVGLILALATCFKPSWSPVTAPAYALAEGLFLGGISFMYNEQFGGIVLQAVCLTFGTLFTMLVAYQTGVVRATQKFRAGVTAGVGAVCLLYLASFVLSMVGSNALGFIHSNGMFGIGFSVAVVVLAALCLVLDFDQIERGAQHGAPKYMEWYGAFALMVTLIWLYLEILRLLAKLRD